MTVWNPGHDKVTPENTTVVYLGKAQTGVLHRCEAGDRGEVMLKLYQATHASKPVIWCAGCDTLFVGENPPKETD